MRRSSRLLLTLAALASGLVGCGGVVFFGGGGGGDALVVRNRSAEAFYVRIDTGPQTNTYRIAPGESGLAIPRDPAAPTTKLTVYKSNCDLFSETTDPPFGEMILDGGGMSFSPGTPPDAASLPLLTLDDRCE